MAYIVVFEKRAGKELGALQTKAYLAISNAIDELSLNPRLQGYIKLQGNLNLYRYRIGDYRIIYSISDEAVTIFIIKIAHRKDVYR